MAGCHRPATPDDPGANSTSTAATPTPDSDGVRPATAPDPRVGAVESLKLLAHESANPYLKNNAKAALEAWNQRDYDQAVVYVKTMISLQLTPEQQASVLAALESMRETLDRAAQAGNPSAKAALLRLGTIGVP